MCACRPQWTATALALYARLSILLVPPDFHSPPCRPFLFPALSFATFFLLSFSSL
jgi:hypothetical protein